MNGVPSCAKYFSALRDTRSFRVELLVLALAILLYVSLASWNLRSPGLYYDEALFINAALGAREYDSFVASRLFGVPLMTMPYIGALKSWIFAPIFAVFGITVLTIRFPAICISAVTLIFCFLLLRRFTGSMVAALTVLALSIDPCFILHTRVDHGPIVLMLLLKICSVFFLLKGVEDQSWQRFALGLFCIILGLWDKLNFVWLVLSLFLASPLFFRQTKALFQKEQLPMLISSGVFVATLLFIYHVLISPLLHAKERPVLHFVERVAEVTQGSNSTLNGTAFSHWVFKDFTSIPTLSPNAVIVILIAGLAAMIFLGTPGRLKQISGTTAAMKGIALFATLYLMIFALIVLTPEAGGPHHFMTLWPFHYFVVASFVALMMKSFSTAASQFRTLKLIGAGAAFVLVCVFNMFSATGTINALVSKPLRPIWSTSIYKLSDFARAQTAKELCWIVSVDWGVGTQIEGLSGELARKTCRDYWTEFGNLVANSPAEKHLDQMVRICPIYAVLYAPGLAIFPGNRKHFFEMVARRGMHVNRAAVLNDADGTPCYEVFAVTGTVSEE